MNFEKPLSVVAIALLVVIMSVAVTLSQTTVSVTPETSSVVSGHIVTVFVSVNNVTNLHGVHTVFTFNNQVIQVATIAEGPFLGSTGEQVFFAQNPQPGPSVNSVTFDQAILAPGGVSGSGVLFSVTFNAVMGGTSEIALSAVDARDPVNNTIPVVPLSGTVTIVDSSINLHIAQGWNLISLPVRRPDARRTTVFPSAISQAFCYRGAYYASDTLFNSLGYWLKFASAQDITAQGAVIARDTVNVQRGWNMIGSISRAVATSTIVTSPANLIGSPFYGYHNGYGVTDTIVPGKGYWVKTTTAGSLILVPQGAGLARAGMSVKEELSQAQKLEVGDSVMGIQSIYFTDDVQADMGPERYELPPPPPSGVFDVRYASNRILEQARNGDTKECFIHISSPVYPVSISWKNVTSCYAFLVVGKQVIWLRGSGSTQVEDQYTKVLLKFSDQQEVPRTFSLDQNYPNPFNPGTTIRYQLPVDSYVRIKIFNTLGEEVKTLVDGIQLAGFKTIEWNSTSNSGRSVSSGLYFCRFEAAGLSGESRSAESRKILLLK